MEAANDGSGSFLDSAVSLLNDGVAYLPGILAVVLLLAVGWFIAHLARRGVKKIGLASNRLLARVFPSGVLSGARMSSLAVTLAGEIVFWAIILISLTMAARVAELGTVSLWLDRITAHLPNLIAGIVIVATGYLLSAYVREQLLPQVESASSSASPLLGRGAQVAIMAVAVIIALDQVGIDVVLLIALAVVVAAALLIAVSVAFASGARAHISNLLGVRAANANLGAGMTIRIGDIEGEIIELASGVVALDTDHGRVLIPGKIVEESVITVLASAVGKERGDA